jgi:ribosomal protein S18 acetylase RimI-like enzyme
MAGKKLFRMELSGPPLSACMPHEIEIGSYSPFMHHGAIRQIYAEAFSEEPWPVTWDKFEEFDPNGVFVAVHAPTGSPVGYVIGFRRGESGYVSVVAVVPAWRRRGVASALLQTAVDYLHSLGLGDVKIDVEAENIPALEAYRKLGFQVARTIEEDPEGAGRQSPRMQRTGSAGRSSAARRSIGEDAAGGARNGATK